MSTIASDGTRVRVRQRLDSLTGLRFFAAFAVFGFHSLYYGREPLAEGFFAAGATGVSFFYIVSGFVLAWAARGRTSKREFYRRRFARIYPAYVVAWLVSLGILLVSGRGIALLDFIPLTLLQSWVPSESVYFAANAVFWSLSCEAFFYVAFPFVFPQLARQTNRVLAVTFVVVVVVVAIITTVVSLLGSTNFGFWATTIFPPMRFAEFILGVILAILMKNGFRWRVPLWVAAVFALAAYAVANFAPEAPARVLVTLLPFCLLVWSAATADLDEARSILRSKLLVTLGVWSYAFYLIHTQSMTATFEIMERVGIHAMSLDGWGLALAVTASFFVAVAAAAALHLLVEAPLERKLRGKRARVKA